MLKNYPAGAIVPAYEEWIGLHEGSIDFAGVASTAMIGEIRFGSIIAHDAARIPPLPFYIWMEAIGSDLANKWYDKLGYNFLDIKGAGFHGPPEIFMHSSKPLRTPDDYKGMNVRISGDAAEAFKRMGASTVFMPGGEIYESMQRGLIDAFEFSSPNFNYEMGMHELAKYIYVSPVRAPSEGVPFMVNRGKWEALPDDLKLLVSEIARSEVARYHSGLVVKDADALQKFAEYGNIVEDLPQSIVEAFSKNFDESMDDIAAEYPEFKEFLDSQRDWAVMWNDLYGLPEWGIPPDEWR